MAGGFDYTARLDMVRAELQRRQVDAALLSVGRDLLYCTGYEATALERLTMAVIPAVGEPVLVVPELEAPRVTRREDAFTVRSWAETEDPVDIIAALVGRPRRLAIGNETWSVFLLALQHHHPETVFIPAAEVTAPLRIHKSDAEIDHLRAAAAAADRVVAALRNTVFSGRSERDIAETVERMTVDEGHDVKGFAIVAGGADAASPHHEPGRRVLRPGDGVVVDFGGRVAGYYSDTTRMFHIGEPGTEYIEAYDALRAAQQAGVEAVRPGVAAAEIDDAARRVLDDAGYGEYFIHRTGHGIGLDVHEAPYLVAGNRRRVEAGMTFSIEPGVYIPGRFGMRIEDIVAVTSAGSERLNRSPRDLAVVG